MTLINSILKAYEKLIKNIDQAPAEDFHIKKFSGTGGKVSVADLLAYQIGWGNMLINWYEKGKKEELFIMPGEDFKTWDYISIAKHF